MGLFSKFKNSVSREWDRFTDRASAEINRVADNEDHPLNEVAEFFTDDIPEFVDDTQDAIADIKRDFELVRHPERGADSVVEIDYEPHAGEPTHHVICIAGTGQRQNDGTPDNPEKIYNSLSERDENGMVQRGYMVDGPGTHSSGANGVFGSDLGDLIDQGTGGDYAAIMMEAYKEICLTYQPGDKITIVGSSRGAVMADELTDMIDRIGIVNFEGYDLNNPEDVVAMDALAMQAYDLHTSDGLTADHPMLIEFQENFTFLDRPSMALGTFDPVDSRGLPGEFRRWTREDLDYYDREIGNSADYAINALALDETRDKFTPLVMGPDTIGDPTRDEAVFPGAHASVTGGSPALEGMSDSAAEYVTNGLVQNAGLGLDPELLATNFNPDPTIQPNMDFTENQPFWDLTGTSPREFYAGIEMDASVNIRRLEVAGYDPVQLRDQPTMIARQDVGTPANEAVYEPAAPAQLGPQAMVAA